MDLQKLETKSASESGARMVIHLPGTKTPVTHERDGHNEPQEMYLTLLGPDSHQVQAELAKVRNRTANTKEKPIPSEEEMEAEKKKDSVMLARLTVGGEVFFNGEWVTVNEDNAYKIYVGIDAVRSQALQFIIDRENFYQG